MKKIYIVLGMLLGLGFQTNAQTVTETATMISDDVYGSARVVGVNGSFGTMGGDYSSVMYNPAGIGVYKKGEFVFTPSYENINVTPQFDQKANGTSSQKGYFGISQIGIVFTDNDDLNRNNFVIGYNKTQSFKRNYSVSGPSEGSITQTFIENTDGIGLDDLGFISGLAYDAGAIYVDSTATKAANQTIYGSDYKIGEANNKNLVAKQSGTSGEINLGWGRNIDKELNIGISVGIPIISYKETRTYSEEFSSTNFSNDLTYTQYNEVTGAGINLKLGAIYTPNQNIRLGVAIHTPSYLQLQNNYNSTLNYKYSSSTESGDNFEESPYGKAEYDLITPFKAIASVGKIFRSKDVSGFVNIDFEHKNYGSAKYDLSNYDAGVGEIENTDALNADIGGALKNVNTVRLGSEIAFKYFRLRGGLSYANSAYEKDDRDVFGWAIGTGYSGNKFFLDVAYRRAMTKEIDPLYSFSNINKSSPTSNLSSSKGLLAITLGFRL